jgi:hypothetical protein
VDVGEDRPKLGDAAAARARQGRGEQTDRRLGGAVAVVDQKVQLVIARKDQGEQAVAVRVDGLCV